MKKVVELFHKGFWYKCYGDDAKVVAFLTDYKLFEDSKHLQPSVGFPEYSLPKVIDYLVSNKINYVLVNDENKVRDFGLENNYDRFLFDDLPLSHTEFNAQISKKAKGYFIVQYEDENPTKYIIGEDINVDAELTKKVIENSVGSEIFINDYRIIIIEKNINYD